jgi:hypothetical protein
VRGYSFVFRAGLLLLFYVCGAVFIFILLIQLQYVVDFPFSVSFEIFVFCPTLLPRRKNNNNMSYANTPREIAIPHTPSMIRNNLSFDTKNQIVRRRIHRQSNVDGQRISH